MTQTPPDLAPLDESQTTFLGEPVSINLASRSGTIGGALLPSIARAYGCRVCDGGHTLVVFLSIPRAQAVLRDLAAGAPVAVCFSRPKTHVTLQIKGERAEVLPLAPGDRAIMETYGRAFAEEIDALGYPAEFTRGLVAGVADEAVGIRFTVGSVFEQTPGPHAGERLGPRR